MKVQQDFRGFTPVLDVLVEEVGPMPAIVYGAIWRFCQMSDHVCRASLEKIADRAGVSYATAQRHVKALCAAGYLEDLTPDLRNRPHRYRDTGKATRPEAPAGDQDYETYTEYLQTRHWKSTRAAALARARYRCSACEATGALHVHHLHYQSLGHERPEDLAVLCGPCHMAIHGLTPPDSEAEGATP